MFTVNGKNTNIHYDQTKRVIDTFLKDLKNTKQAIFWLETCNMNAACCAIEAVGKTFKFALPEINNNKCFGNYADLMFNFLYLNPNTPVRSDTLCENEIPENITFAINNISTATAELKRFTNIPEMITSLKADLNTGHGIVLSYRTDYGSGHFICLVGYENDKIYAYDSWPNNIHCKNGGILEEYDPTFFEDRCKERLRYIAVI